MKRVGAMLAVFVVAGSAAVAQAPSEPHLVFSITGGLTSGGKLWSVEKQPQPVPGSNPITFDTLALQRVLRPGIVAGLAATYFKAKHFGLTAEVTYFGVASEQRCTGLTIDTTEAEQINRQACDGANGQHRATNVVGFMAGGTYRFLPDAPIEPFVRATVGPGWLGDSFIETSGVIRSTRCGTSDNVCVYSLLLDPKLSQLTFVASLSGGLAFRLNEAYRVRFEGRDVIVSLPVVTGPASLTTAAPPNGRTIKHIPTFTIGLDVVLERRHTRRY